MNLEDNKSQSLEIDEPENNIMFNSISDGPPELSIDLDLDYSPEE